MTTSPLCNRLSQQTSPYLLQHANDPVAWQPWDEIALRSAYEQNKPILLSIGYSACHWCHVMAHESFQDKETARIMNELFVSIKVDREERPDLDKIYQTAQMIITQRNGGWPLTMFLTPQDQTPFFGGTYFPKEPRHGLPPFKHVLEQIHEYYVTKKIHFKNTKRTYIVHSIKYSQHTPAVLCKLTCYQNKPVQSLNNSLTPATVALATNLNFPMDIT